MPVPVNIKEIIESYPIQEPFASVSIVKDENDAYVYVVNEPLLEHNEIIAYSKLLNILQYELQLPDDPNVDPKSYFEYNSKRIIKKYINQIGIKQNITLKKIYYYIMRDMIGFAAIDVMMRDNNIEDISIDGLNRWIYIWHRKHGSIRSNIIFTTEQDLDNTIIKLVHLGGKHISTAYPIVDATLPGKHRLVSTYRNEVSPHGSSLTIRKFKEDPLSIIDLINLKSISVEIAAYIWLLLDHTISAIVVGSTASGKTTLLNAMISMIRPTAKLVTIEEVQEINIYHQNWLSLITKHGYGFADENVGEVTLFDLVKTSLRMRPDFLIVGEVRGEEAYVLFQAISTGHGGLCTLHADDVETAIERLTSKPMNVAPSQIKFLDLALTSKNVLVSDDKTTKRKRRVTEVREILDYKSSNKIFQWDSTTDTHMLTLQLKNSEKLKMISRNTGVSINELLEEIKRRENILKYLQLKGIRNIKEIGLVIEQYHQKKEAFYANISREIQQTTV